MWSVSVLTLFPDLFPGPLAASVSGRALERGIWSIHPKNIRGYALDRHGTVDDAPYGGGSGMVMRADVLGAAVEAEFLPNRNEIIYLSPRGKRFTQRTATELIAKPGVNIICGRFEGIDERLINEYRISEVSIGDFVLSSGDIAAYCLLDACIRMLPGVVGNDESLIHESFGVGSVYEHLLEYPHFTKPQNWKGRLVPEVLLSGNHGVIKAWRLSQAEAKTKEERPDLWKMYLNR